MELGEGYDAPCGIFVVFQDILYCATILDRVEFKSRRSRDEGEGEAMERVFVCVAR